MLPQAFKKQLAPILQDGFVLKRAVFQKCLELYPIAEWNTLSAKVNKLNRFNRRMMSLYVVSMQVLSQ